LNTPRKQHRVVIVGAGIVGLATAHHLARLGETSVLVLERESIPGTGSSGASAGGLRQQFDEEENILFAREGVRQVLALREETGFDPEFRQHGYLLLASTEKRRRAFERNVALQNRLGLGSEVLTPDDVERRWPVLTTGDLTAAAFCGSDGYCDPHAILQAFLATARSAGIEVRTSTTVTGLTRSGERITGVETNGGAIAAEFVVNAAGPRGGEIAAMAGVDLPLRPCRRQIFTTDAVPVPRDLPLVIDMDRPFYFRPEGEGVLLSAAEVEETRDFDTTLDESGLPELVERAVHRCPALEEASIAGGWAGIRTLTPDGSAILGDAPGAPGLLLAVGMSGHGITHAPAVGLTLAERIVLGEPRTLDPAPFRAARFRA
jgi:sarcosine oxidase subunit beta